MSEIVRIESLSKHFGSVIGVDEIDLGYGHQGR